jgi:hypothetical protein
MDLKRMGQRAKDLVDKRGGTDALKQDAEELKRIAKGQGTLSDKAKAAAQALKDPGTRGSAESPAAEAASPRERERAGAKVRGEGRGKHADAAEPDTGSGKRHGDALDDPGRGRGRV